MKKLMKIYIEAERGHPRVYSNVNRERTVNILRNYADLLGVFYGESFNKIKFKRLPIDIKETKVLK